MVSEREQEYVLGTHDAELERLGLQHRAWRPRALAAWAAAGIASGQTVLDVGCGPGYAALDLAELVGPHGRVVAIDKSERFLSALDAMRSERGLNNIDTYKADLDAGEFPELTADRAWCRWVLCFTQKPRDLLARLAAALEPQGVLVLHEYFDYSTWKAAPPCPELEEFVTAVMASWRDTGGEPNVALTLPSWLEAAGFEIKSLRPIVDIVQKGDMRWAWLRAFIEVGRRRLVDLGYLSESRSESIWHEFTELEARSGTWMTTPGVLEIIGARRTLKREI
jgi:SAM-dependent methyltransferase